MDIISFCVLIDFIKPSKIISSIFPMGIGSIKCAHGIMPNPAPATLQILKNMPVYQTSIKGEMVTPTAAALLKHFVNEYSNSFDGVVKCIGNGAGKYEYEGSSCICRALLIEKENNAAAEKHYIIEANIDDMTGESLSYIQMLLMDNGASDVWFTPIIMKKSRPAYTIHILSIQEKKHFLIDMLLNESTTLGLRIIEVDKIMLNRESIEVETKYGIVRYKKRITINGKSDIKVEYEDAKSIALKTKRDINSVMLELILIYYHSKSEVIK